MNNLVCWILSLGLHAAVIAGLMAGWQRSHPSGPTGARPLSINLVAASVKHKSAFIPTNTSAASDSASASASDKGAQLTSAFLLSRDYKIKTGNPIPAYPWIDRVKHREGEVVVKGFLKSDGSLLNVTVIHSSGSRSLDRAAQVAFEQWKFVPGPTGWVIKPFLFRLDK